MSKVQAPKGMSKAEFANWYVKNIGDPNKINDKDATKAYAEYRKQGFTINAPGESLVQRATGAVVGAVESLPGVRYPGSDLFGGGGSSSQSTTPSATPGAPAATPAQSAAAAAQNQNVNDLFTGPNSATGGSAATLFQGNLNLNTTMLSQRALSPGARGLRGPEIPAVDRVTKSANDWLLDLYKMSKPTLTALQWTMFKAGWYDASITDPKQIQFGKPDPATLGAFTAAMTETARYNAADHPLQTIDETIALGGPNTNGAKGAKSPAFDITNPLNVQQAYRDAAQAVVGGGLSPADEAAFQQAFSGQEGAAYSRYAQAGQDRAAGLGGAYVGRPDVGAAAKDYILTHNQQDVVNYDMALRTMQFQAALKEL